jgi:integrase
VRELWAAYVADKAGRAIVGTMAHTWKALRERFGEMDAEAITVADCRAHMAERRTAGIKDGTLLTELGHLRMVLRWAEKQKLIAQTPHVERPPKPKPSERHLTREQARALRDAATHPHLKLFIVLAQTTGARSAALLQLTWDRVDFERGQIDLRNPFLKVPHKGRAIVPMNRDARAALLEARAGALSPYVIEWGGKPVASVKKGLRVTAARAGLGHVSPHMLRHSAAVHMAEAGVPMDEIAQYLGHTNARVTREVYARFSPDYLRNAAAALEYDDLGSLNRKSTTSPRCKQLISMVVDAAPIEPVSSAEIPRKLGKYWEFRSFWTLRGPNRRAVSKACRQNSHARELGIYFKEMGKRKTEKRNKRKPENGRPRMRWVGPMHQRRRCSNGDKSVCCS